MISAVAGVITASEPSWTAPFAGPSPRAFGKSMRQLRREGGDAPGRGRPWKLSLEDRSSAHDNRALLISPGREVRTWSGGGACGTASQPAGGTASGRDAKISRRAANSAGPQVSVFVPVIMQDPQKAASPVW